MLYYGLENFLLTFDASVTSNLVKLILVWTFHVKTIAGFTQWMCPSQKSRTNRNRVKRDSDFI